MASLIVKFADLASEPVGSGNAVDAEVLVSYTREVPLTDGTVLQAVPMRKQLGPGGTATFPVTPSDSTSVIEDFRGFGVRVEWLMTHRGERARQTEKRRARTVKVLTADGATVQFGRLLPAEDVGPQYATVGELLGDVTDVYATVDNLTATATALPPGASPTVTVSGPVPNKVINIGVPRGADGAPGMGYEEGQQLLNQNADTLAAAQAAVGLAGPSEATYRHPRGEAEMAGVATYKGTDGNTWPGYMIRQLIPAGAHFNQLRVYLAAVPGATVTARIYVREAASILYANLGTPEATVTLAEGEVPRATWYALTPGPVTINLPAAVTVPAGHYVHLAITSNPPGGIAIRWFSDGAHPDRDTFGIISSPTAGGYQSDAGIFKGTAVELALLTVAGEALRLAKAATSGTAPARVLIAPTVHAVIGDTLQLFTESMIEHPAPASVPTMVDSSIGAAYPRHYEHTPAAAGDTPATVRVMDLTGATVTSKSTTLKVKAAPASPATPKRVMVIGDSLTAAGTWVPELRRRLVGTGGTPAALGLSNVSFLGNTPMPGAPSEGYFGVGGWTLATWMGTEVRPAYWLTVASHDKDASDQKAQYRDGNNKVWTLETIEAGRVKIYSSVAGAPPASGTLTWVSGGTHTTAITYSASEAAASTPFWNPTTNTFSMKYWTDTYAGGQAPDLIPVLIGWNGMPAGNTGTAADHTTARGQWMAFLDKVKAEHPSARVLALGLQMPSPTGGTGANYGATGAYADAYRLRRKAAGYNLMLQEVAALSSYSGMTTFVDVAAQVDSRNGHPTAATPVNVRSTLTEQRGTNGIHPNTSGYLQIADAAYRAICHHI